jgi:hypothetical protein
VKVFYAADAVLRLFPGDSGIFYLEGFSGHQLYSQAEWFENL